MKQKEYIFESEKELRVVIKTDGTKMYCLSDIAKCLGYKAPTKFSQRSDIKKEKQEFRWKTGIKNGRSLMWCVSFVEFLKLANAFRFPEKFVRFVRNLENPVQKTERNETTPINSVDDEGFDVESMMNAIDTVMYACLDMRKKLNLRKASGGRV